LNELGPGWCPLINGWVASWFGHLDIILWVGIVISNGWVDLERGKAISNVLGNVLHDCNICLKSQRIEVMRNRITAPENNVWLDIVSDFLEETLKSM